MLLRENCCWIRGGNAIRRQIAALSIFMITGLATTLQAQMVIEPVFNRVAGTGPAENGVGVRAIVNLFQTNLGISPLWTAQPGEVYSYVSGDPRKADLDELFFFNDTDIDVTGFSLSIIGTGTNTDDPTTIVRGAPIDARFGDVDGDGKILSDIFSSYQISADGRSIDFRGGLLQPGDRYTAIHLAHSASCPLLAGIDSYVVPEPSTGGLAIAAALVTWIGARRKSAARA